MNKKSKPKDYDNCDYMDACVVPAGLRSGHGIFALDAVLVENIRSLEIYSAPKSYLDFCPFFSISTLKLYNTSDLSTWMVGQRFR